VKSKAKNPVELLEGKAAPAFIRAYFELSHLKQLYRQGWLRRGVVEAKCETVAEHSFAVAVLAMWLAQAYFPGLDQCKVLKMALLHDLGEIYAGDIIPADKIEPQAKHCRETDSIHRLLDKLPEGAVFLELWEEFEKGASPEARLVRQVDRLEMGLQAGVYRLQGAPEMQEFLDSARLALEDAPLVELFDRLEGMTD
jgi:putative hydrolase of HD superfamily